MEKFNLRFIQIGMVGSVALFFTLVAFDNMVASRANWDFIQHVLSMDTVPDQYLAQWRAITNPYLQLLAFYLIIFWQVATAAMCWAGCFRLAKGKKETAYIGLFMGFLLYMVGFLVIAGEWFCMSQSPTHNVQMKAGLFLSFIMYVMIFLQGSKE